MSHIRRWWHSIKVLPAWGVDLRSLLTPTIGVLAGTLPIVPTVQWSEEEQTAYADRANNRLVIGANIFSPFPSRRLNPSASKEQAAEAALGFVVHEGMHFVYSPENCPALLNEGLPVDAITCSIANIIEDLFIEYKAPNHDKNFGWMIAAEWEYLWPAAAMEEMLAGQWDGKNTENLEGIINTMAAWKNQNYDFKFRTDFESDLHELCVSVFSMRSLQERKDLIEKVIRFLISDEELEKRQEEAKGEGSGDGDGEGGEAPFNTKGERVAVVAGAAERGEILCRPKDFRFANSGAEGNIPYFVRIVKPSSTRFAVSDTKKWEKLARWASDVGSVRTHRGTPGNYGRLTHPARFLDDGKIFSKIERSAPSGRISEGGAPQTIILVDFSGSMGGLIKGFADKFEAALHVAAGAASALVQAKHRVSVYGHTTEGRDYEVVVLHRIKSVNESVEHMLKGLETLRHKGAMDNNADATALSAVTASFKEDGSTKRVFVISDGQPYCEYYGGRTGINITKKVVDGLRRKGVEVYSLSIDSSAIAPNNEIYGPKFNFDVTDPKVADNVLKTVLGSVQ